MLDVTVAHDTLAPAVELARKATWDDLLDVPEGYIGEIIDGRLVMSPRPAAPHVETASALGALLVTSFDFGINGPGGWKILDEPRMGFGEDVRVPDLAGWHRKRYRAPDKGPYTVRPDWIGEVLSPGTQESDRTEKLDLYRKHKVRHVWLIDPAAHTIEIFRAGKKAWVELEPVTGSVKARIEPFSEVELDLTLIWRSS